MCVLLASLETPVSGLKSLSLEGAMQENWQVCT